MTATRPVPKVYLFYGDDHARRAAFIARLRERLAQEAGDWADLNYHRLDGDTHTLADLDEAARVPPMFARRRMVHAVNPLAWARTAQGRDALLAVLDAVPASTALVLDIDQRLEESRGRRPAHWLLQWARQRGPRHVYLKAVPAPRNPDEMTQWLLQAAADVPARLTPQAAHALAAAIGPDTLRGVQELRKLALYAGDRPITPQDVDALVEGHWAPDLFRWLDLVGAGRTAESWRFLQRLRESRGTAFVWHMLLRHFRLLLVLRDALEQGAAVEQVARMWNIPSFALPRYVQQARRFSLPALRAVYRTLYRLEDRFRRHEITLDEALEDLLAYLSLHGTRTP